MAVIHCPGCGEAHKYTATALAVLLQASLDGELHTVGIYPSWVKGRPRRAVMVLPVCTLDLVPENMRSGRVAVGSE